jgi:hypothetical protein
MVTLVLNWPMLCCPVLHSRRRAVLGSTLKAERSLVEVLYQPPVHPEKTGRLSGGHGSANSGIVQPDLLYD